MKELGGVSPDSLVEDIQRSAYYMELLRKALFFKFATTYVSKHPTVEGEFAMNENVTKEFELYLKDQKFEFTEPAEKKLSELKEQMTKDRYSSTSLSSIDVLLKQMHAEKLNSVTRYNEELWNELNEELNSRYSGEKGRARIALNYDTQVQTASSLLLNKKVYEGMLKPKK